MNFLCIFACSTYKGFFQRQEYSLAWFKRLNDIYLIHFNLVNMYLIQFLFSISLAAIKCEQLSYSGHWNIKGYLGQNQKRLIIWYLVLNDYDILKNELKIRKKITLCLWGRIKEQMLVPFTSTFIAL